MFREKKRWSPGSKIRNPIRIRIRHINGISNLVRILIFHGFGFDTAENEPEYGYGISLLFVSLLFGPDCVIFGKYCITTDVLREEKVVTLDL